MGNASVAFLSEKMAKEIAILVELGLLKSAFVTLEQLHEFGGGTPSLITLYRKARSGALPARNHFGRIVVYVPEFLEWSAAHRQNENAPSKRRGPSVSKFQEVRSNLRSLTTEVTVLPHQTQKRRVHGNS